MRSRWEGEISAGFIRRFMSRPGFGRLLSIAVLALLSVMVFMAFGKISVKEESGAEGEVYREPLVLRVWYPWTDEEEIYKKAFLNAVDKCNKNHQEVQILPEGIATKLYREKLPSAIASNDTPDIYLCYTNAYLENAVNSGKVLRLDDYLSRKAKERILPGMEDAVTFEKGIYGLGFAKDAGVFFVNNEMLQEYGCSLPESWEELVEVCRIFLDNGIVPLACSADADRGFRMYLEALCMSEAGAEECLKIISGEKEVTEEFLRGINRFCELRDMGAFGRIPAQNTTGGVEEEFYLSRIPMYFTKNRIAGNILQGNNPLYGKISAAPFPGTEGLSMLGGVSETFVVNKATRYPKAAVSTLEELMYYFSINLKESNAGIPVWFLKEDTEEEEAELDEAIREMDAKAEETMPYWEFYLGGERSVSFMRESGKLYRNEISIEEFTESLSP